VPGVDELYRVFAAGVPPGGGVPSAAEAAAASAALAQVVTAARAAHPHLDVDAGRFVAHVARHAPAAPGEWAETLERLHAGDLYLALACAEDVAGALAVFEELCGAAVDGVLRSSPDDVRDDVKQLLRERLFVGDGEGGAGPRILTYAGRGPLAGWVAVSAQRTAHSLQRHEASTRARHARARHELPAALHPELGYLKQKYRAAFAEAFEGALGAITDRERTLLRLHLLQRLRLDQIAPMFHVDTSTVSRWLAAARASLLAHTRELLATRFDVSSEEFGSIARLVQSQIDVSLVRLLADDPPER
jgi:RNA polymerase sigma-70 factor (ECF subfamily)